MISKASVAKHPIHPMLVPLPIGLWIFSLICDIIYKSNGDLLWNTMAHYSLAAGVIGGLLAALPGLIDFLALPSSSAKRIGLWHLGLNLGITGLYIANFFWRRADPTAAGPFALSVLAILLLVVSGWLGGEMVYVHGVAVAPADETGTVKKHPA